MESEKIQKVRAQIEYYLSDKNLEFDGFFHDLISTSKTGHIPVEFFLKCKKIEELKCTPKEIIEAIATSASVEGSEADGIKRKSDAPLPTLKMRKKVQKNEEGQKQEAPKNGEEEKKEEKPEPIGRRFEYLVFDLVPSAEISVKARDLQDEAAKVLEIDVPFLRATKWEANLILNKLTTSQDVKEKVLKGFEALGIKFTVKELTNQRDIELFEQKHRHHIDKLLKARGFQMPRGGKNKKKKMGPIVFNGQKFQRVSKVRLVYQNIMAKTPNGAPITSQNDYGYMVALWKHIQGKKDEEMTGVKEFIIENLGENSERRSFFAVKDDGSKEELALKYLEVLGSD